MIETTHNLAHELDSSEEKVRLISTFLPTFRHASCPCTKYISPCQRRYASGTQRAPRNSDALALRVRRCSSWCKTKTKPWILPDQPREEDL